jgi:hypothetical protein
MDTRTTIAIAALQGLIASNFYVRYMEDFKKSGDYSCQDPVKVAAEIAVEYADALIRALD